MAKNVGDSFAKQVDKSKFVVENAGALKQQASNVAADAGNINYDWSAVDESIGRLSGVQDTAIARAGGEGVTADYWARRQTKTEQPRTLADVGRLLVQNARSAQAAQFSNAKAEQMAQEQEKANKLNNIIFAARQRMQSQELGLQNEKFKIQQSMSQATQGLDLAQKAMLASYNQLLANARTGAEAIRIRGQQANLNNILGYAQLAGGAASQVTASWAGSLKSAPPAAPVSTVDSVSAAKMQPKVGR